MSRCCKRKRTATKRLRGASLIGPAAQAPIRATCSYCKTRSITMIFGASLNREPMSLVVNGLTTASHTKTPTRDVSSCIFSSPRPYRLQQVTGSADIPSPATWQLTSSLVDAGVVVITEDCALSKKIVPISKSLNTAHYNNITSVLRVLLHRHRTVQLSTRIMSIATALYPHSAARINEML